MLENFFFLFCVPIRMRDKNGPALQMYFGLRKLDISWKNAVYFHNKTSIIIVYNKTVYYAPREESIWHYHLGSKLYA